MRDMYAMYRYVDSNGKRRFKSCSDSVYIGRHNSNEMTSRKIVILAKIGVLPGISSSSSSSFISRSKPSALYLASDSISINRLSVTLNGKPVRFRNSCIGIITGLEAPLRRASRIVLWSICLAGGDRSSVVIIVTGNISGIPHKKWSKPKANSLFPEEKIYCRQ